MTLGNPYRIGDSVSGEDDVFSFHKRIVAWQWLHFQYVQNRLRNFVRGWLDPSQWFCINRRTNDLVRSFRSVGILYGDVFSGQMVSVVSCPWSLSTDEVAVATHISTVSRTKFMACLSVLSLESRKKCQQICGFLRGHVAEEEIWHERFRLRCQLFNICNR